MLIAAIDLQVRRQRPLARSLARNSPRPWVSLGSTLAARRELARRSSLLGALRSARHARNRAQFVNRRGDARITLEAYVHANPTRLLASARQQQPGVEVEQHAVVVLAVGLLEREGRAVAGSSPPRAAMRSAPTSLAARQLGLLQHLRPGIDRVAGKAGRHVPAAVDRREMERVVQPVERQRARERDDDAAIDDALAEAALAPRVC